MISLSALGGNGGGTKGNFWLVLLEPDCFTASLLKAVDKHRSGNMGVAKAGLLRNSARLCRLKIFQQIKKGIFVPGVHPDQIIGLGEQNPRLNFAGVAYQVCDPSKEMRRVRSDN